MNGKMKKKSIAGLIAIAAIIAVVIFTGCVGKYSVDSVVVEGYLDVNVSGPAEDLAVILTNPEGYTDIKYISKEAMIDNFESVSVRMCGRGGNPSAGTYKLVVKTVTPEKVVYETEMKFKSAIVRITDVEMRLKWHPGYGGAYGYSGYLSGKYNISVRNDGELPVVIDNTIVVLDGEALETYSSMWGGIRISPGESRNIVNEVRENYYYVPTISSAVIELYSEGELVASSEAEIIFEY